MAAQVGDNHAVAGGKVVEVILPVDLWKPTYVRGSPYGPPDRVRQHPWPEEMAIGLTPAWVLFESLIPSRTYWPSYYYEAPYMRIEQLWPWVLLGLLVYASAALVLARRAAAWFRRSVGRVRPGGPSPAGGRPQHSPTKSSLDNSTVEE